ncbi:hypothetical protein [Janibacter cremeus]|uniref:DUF4439 domain-containing protein n=1 Tax=Janibacter cremeus TaxID=1285192 RepID=A0A852VLY8_9MICO|nr:hypothetical protein [Janibacter cremeus]NYF97116.1 hypothetical protein [Janibacter cremeus]
MPSPPSRRRVLAGALAAGVTTLSGCGVRLEDGAPHIPFVPTREPVPGESALLAMLGALETSDEEHAGERADLLRTALLDAQVPQDLVDGVTAPAPGGEVVSAFEGSIRDCGPGVLPLIGRLTATHRITTHAQEDLWSQPGTKAWSTGAVAADARQATLATIYALDLIAARATDERISKQVLDAGKGLRQLSVRQTTAAGEAVRPAPLGYDVPHELTPQEGRALGRRCFERLLAAYGGTFYRLGDDRAAALEVTEWMVTVEQLSRGRFSLVVPVLYGDDPTAS